MTTYENKHKRNYFNRIRETIFLIKLKLMFASARVTHKICIFARDFQKTNHIDKQTWTRLVTLWALALVNSYGA